MTFSSLFRQPSFSRPPTLPDGAVEYFNGAVRIWDAREPDGLVSFKQLFKTGSEHSGKGRESTATPPLHWHLYQTEALEVLGGKAGYVLDGKQAVASKGEKVLNLILGRIVGGWVLGWKTQYNEFDQGRKRE
ncbi:hypothetical protein JCM8547_007518 [Rhodosporidiobolus lusitaniae]